jgi:pyruvate dehydrogenase E1 component
MTTKPSNTERDIETREWVDSLDYILESQGPDRVRELLKELQVRAYEDGVRFPFTANTPYINTIPASAETPYPGDRDIERRIKSIIRWNAMAMVVRANRRESGIGGHISTYASSATLYEVGFNHFFRARTDDFYGDAVYVQGHASPGIYARAFLEGRLTRSNLMNFRRELEPSGGISSYPHPRLMPDFWQFPTVSMGLGPIMSIYHARFVKYLEHRSLKKNDNGKIWTFCGDGEMDEPEALGAIGMAAREKLDNLIFVINCNLQRLDGPVRGNGKIVQELEGIFRGAGWNVIKLVWGSDWDPLLAADEDGVLLKRMEECVDGEYQKYVVEDGAYIREHFFGKDPRLLKLVEHLSDDELNHLGWGGHDPEKVYAAYHAAVSHTDSPTVILAKTIKGYGLGESGEGMNITHQQKKLNEAELREFRSRFGIPISDRDIRNAPLYLPDADSPEIVYLHERRAALGGYVPSRSRTYLPIQTPPESFIEPYFSPQQNRELSTTQIYGDILRKLLKDKSVGRYVVPIIPDEARTFGLDALFRQVGIYSAVGQLYEPVDANNLSYYKESSTGQILEEGITEAGAVSSFIAAGSAYSTLGIPMIPFYIYYSMFGPQRIGDLLWAAGDMQCKGFLLGATAGRTSLSGEGLQHQDGHSHVLTSTFPSIVSYDPAFGYELALIIRDGIHRMYENDENVMVYLTLGNEKYIMPAMPEGCREGVLKGLYRFRRADNEGAPHRAQLFGSGAILNCVLEAQKLLENYDVAADVWSVTSYNELRRDGLACDRWNLLHPESDPRVPYVSQALAGEKGVLVASSDYMRSLPDSIAKWMPRPLISLGTDGFGLSESRVALRHHFEVDARFVTLAALTGLRRDGRIENDVVVRAAAELEIDPDKPNPMAV